jgi:PAS domain S-box-containing protein
MPDHDRVGVPGRGSGVTRAGGRSSAEASTSRTSPLRNFGDVLGALDRLPIPVFAIAGSGSVRWLNQAAETIVGDLSGQPYTRAVAPQSRAVVRDAFASKLLGGRSATDYEAVLIRKDGSRIGVEICSVPVAEDGKIIGVFGTAEVDHDDSSTEPQPLQHALTPRQAQVLGYLARGSTTDEMARAMGVSKETVRNHVRGLLRALGAHSRLEAVTSARMRGLV